MQNLNRSNEEINKLTRQYIQSAIIKLMSEKPFNQITITELVKKAGVSRTSFYRNYDTKDDVLNEIMENYTRYINDIAMSNNITKNPREWFYSYFKMLHDNKKDIIILTKAQLINFNIFYNKDFLMPANLKAINSYQVAAFYGAMNAILTKWIENDMKESPDEMAILCCEMFAK